MYINYSCQNVNHFNHLQNEAELVNMGANALDVIRSSIVAYGHALSTSFYSLEYLSKTNKCF